MNGHPTREEDFDLYALGALDGDEKNAIEIHLATCSSCMQKLAEARGRIALLAFAAPAVVPSPNVKSRLMSQVRVDKHAEARSPAVSRASEVAGGFFGRWWSAVLVPVGVALAIASVVLWTENRRLDHQLAGLHADMQQQQRQLQDARQVAELITARGTIIVPLAAQPGMPKGTAHVMYNAKMGILMYEGQLEPNPADKTYQLWIVPTHGNPISAGVFNAARTETDHFFMKCPPGIDPKAFAVTLEPSGGRPQPTGPMVLVGALS
jgi:anti-sigma-K factor RskA